MRIMLKVRKRKESVVVRVLATALLTVGRKKGGGVFV